MDTQLQGEKMKKRVKNQMHILRRVHCTKREKKKKKRDAQASKKGERVRNENARKCNSIAFARVTERDANLGHECEADEIGDRADDGNEDLLVRPQQIGPLVDDCRDEALHRTKLCAT